MAVVDSSAIVDLTAPELTTSLTGDDFEVLIDELADDGRLAHVCLLYTSDAADE